MGLSEIPAVRATADFREVGEFTPEVHSWIAINPDSELLPVAPSITLKPVSGGVEIIARYITHVAQREALRAQLYHTAVTMLGAKAQV